MSMIRVRFDHILDLFRQPRAPEPIIIPTQWGPVSEGARHQAALNIGADPALRERVRRLLVERLGSEVDADREMRRRYPESYPATGGHR